jgi:hypothetical protein
MDGDWLTTAASVLRGVRTPMSIGGLAVIVFCVIYNRVLSLGIFSTLNDSQTSGLLAAMVGYAFWLALVAVVLGIAGFIIRPSKTKS